jgi:dihydrofolate synthase / folylpolyglutamate synthase
MLSNEYKETINWLFKQFPSYQLIGSKAYKPTLDNIRSICKQIGDPQNTLRFIHIAGTNGKGSCSAMLASILTESGETVGLFTSPHILDFRERIRINGEMISESEVVAFCRKIQAIDLTFEPSFFEITFAMALEHFKRSSCTICVIETGLGGRLDATNIIDPLVSLITNISLEHTAILGNTLAEIAIEKAGIIKTKTPVVIGHSSAETKRVFLNKAKSAEASIYFSEEENVLVNYDLPLLGSYQKENLRSVLCVLNVLHRTNGLDTKSKIQEGLNQIRENTGFFGRMQVIQKEPLIIFDVSHNLDGIKATLDYFKTLQFEKLHILYGSSADKDIIPIMSLLPDSADLHFTSFKNQRSLNAEELTSMAELAHKKAHVHSDAKKALDQIRNATKKNDIILVLGSFFLLSDLME